MDLAIEALNRNNPLQVGFSHRARAREPACLPVAASAAEAAGDRAALGRFAQWLNRLQLTGMAQTQGTRDLAGNVRFLLATGAIPTRTCNLNAPEVQLEMGLLGAAVVQTAIDLNRLLIASTPAVLTAMRTGPDFPAPAAGARFVGVVRHNQDCARSLRWMAGVDQPTYTPLVKSEKREPCFLIDAVGGAV